MTLLIDYFKEIVLVILIISCKVKTKRTNSKYILSKLMLFLIYLL